MKETRKSRLILRQVSTLAIKIIFSIRKTLIFANKIKLNEPCIIAMFHDEMIPFIEYFKNTGVVILASENHALADVHLWGYLGADVTLSYEVQNPVHEEYGGVPPYVSRTACGECCSARLPSACSQSGL